MHHGRLKVLLFFFFIIFFVHICAAVPDFTYTQGSGAEYLKLTLSGSDRGNVAAWNWEIRYNDDIIPLTGETVSYSFSSVPGDPFTVALNVTYADGTAAMIEKNVVMAEPELEACFSSSVSGGELPLTVTFRDLTYGTHTFEWIINNGTDIYENTADSEMSYTFEVPGIYTVRLTSYTDDEEDPYEDLITVDYPAPDAAFSSIPVTGNPPLKVRFNDLSTISYGSITGWEWDFDNDGKTDSTEQDPEYTYLETGNYNVKLKVTSDHSKTNTTMIRDYIIVTNDPVVSFTADVTSGDSPLSVGFMTETPEGLKINSYSWNFGDGKSSKEENPVHVYETPGTYDVSLIVKYDSGETDTVTKADYIIVKEEPPETPVTTTGTTVATVSPVSASIGAEENGTKIFGIPGTEFFRSESVRFHGLYREWLLILKGILRIN